LRIGHLRCKLGRILNRNLLNRIEIINTIEKSFKKYRVKNIQKM